jgi:hypothetical protein
MVNQGTIGKEIAKALPDLMAEMKNATNSKKGYGYNYAPLNEILDVARPILAKHHFSINQFVGNQDGMVTVTTRLVHLSGEYVESTMVLPLAKVAGANDVQQMGASITYARRYMITAILGIAGEEDTDGNPDGDKKRPKVQPKSQPKSQPENVNDKVDKAIKMTEAYLKANEKRILIEDLDVMKDRLNELKGQPDDNQKYLDIRDFYSSVQNYIKGLENA